MGHSNTEIDVQSLHQSDITWDEVRLNVHHLTFPSGRRIVLIGDSIFCHEFFRDENVMFIFLV